MGVGLRGGGRSQAPDGESCCDLRKEWGLFSRSGCFYRFLCSADESLLNGEVPHCIHP